jgi:PEP-CTERM motif-containing protein
MKFKLVLAGLCFLLIMPAMATAGTVIGANFTGSNLSQSGYIPPDTMGAVGTSYAMELINGRYAVYNKSTGATVTSSSLNAFWSTKVGLTYSGNSFDPRVVYDAAAGRFYAVAVHNGGGANNFLFAVSDSGDPSGSWTGFAIDSDSDDTHWADFPTLGFNNDGVYIAANMFAIVSGATVVDIVVLPKSDLLAATPTIANMTMFEAVDPNNTGYAVQPVVDLDGGGFPALLISDYNTPAGYIGISSLSNSVTSPTHNAATTIAVTSRSSPPDADQPGAGNDIETNDTRFSGNAILVNGSLWAVQAVNISGRSAVQWYRINPSTYAILESGIISDSSLAFYYPSIAANNAGDVVIGFSASSSTVYASSYAVVGELSGGTTTFGTPMLLKAGVASYQNLDGSSRNRWGDYSATVVDPSDSSHFWSTQFTEVIITAPTVIPEPGTFALMGIGGLFLGLCGWRRRQRRK